VSLSREDVDTFTEVMVRKAEMIRTLEQHDDFLRAVIQQVIVDTDLLVSGAVPLSAWFEDET
jgi:hypothetical protein